MMSCDKTVCDMIGGGVYIDNKTMGDIKEQIKKEKLS